MHDLIIIGAGPAGLSAAIYAARYNLKTLVIGELIGGTLTEAWQVDNYPGLPGQSGLAIMTKFKEQAEKLGAEIKPGKVIEIKTISEPEKTFLVKTELAEDYPARALILAVGNKKRLLSVPGEKELLGKGVSYCATCDAAFFKAKTVVVLGAGNAAVTAALLLSLQAEKVYLIVNKPELRAEPVWQKSLAQKKNVELIKNNQVIKIIGQAKVEAVDLMADYRNNQRLKCAGVFVEIGSRPDPALPFKLGLETDDRGYIKVNNQLQTNVPGIFAAGDNTVGFYALRQTITAAASGVIAAASANEYLISATS